MSDMAARFAEIVGSNNLLTGDAIPEDYAHDEELTKPPQKPAYLARPASAEEVSKLLQGRLGTRRSSDRPRVRVRLVGGGAAAAGWAVDRFRPNE